MMGVRWESHESQMRDKMMENREEIGSQAKL